MTWWAEYSKGRKNMREINWLGVAEAICVQPYRKQGKQKEDICFRVQCECGHIILEQYKFAEPQAGFIGFYWCGFCRTRTNVVADSPLQTEEKD